MVFRGGVRAFNGRAQIMDMYVIAAGIACASRFPFFSI